MTCQRGTGEINVAVLGQGFMGKVHSHAYVTVAHHFVNLPVRPVLHAVAGRDEERLRDFTKRFGFRYYSTDWRKVIADSEVDVVNICLPESMHKDACITAIGANKHVVCEKPLVLSMAEADEVLRATRGKKLVLMCGFNYRFLPAVQLARELVQKGAIGQVYSIKANYSQESGHNPERPAEQLGYVRGAKQLGSIRGLGSHLIDIVRFVVGEISSVNSLFRTFHPERKSAEGRLVQVRADEMTLLTIEFENGAVGSLSTSMVATGRKNQLAFEINGSKGSISFDLEQLNVLEVYIGRDGEPELQGFTRINVSDKSHPLMKDWWPPAHILGWEHGHINEMKHFLECVAKGKSVDPIGATFLDGAKAVEIAERAFQASKDGKRYRIGEPYARRSGTK